MYENLASASVRSVDHLVLAAHAFFRNPHGVSDSIHKVIFFEKEADKISTTLKRAIFQSDLEIAQKIHLKSFVEYIDNVADRAEDVADRLSIYAIKRAF